MKPRAAFPEYAMWIATFMFALALVATVTTPAQARVRIGVMAAPQVTELTPRAYDFLGTPDVKWSWTAGGGLTAELPLHGGFALVTGLEYGEHRDDSRSELTLDFGGGPTTLKIESQARLRSIALPARIEWRPGHWRIGAGPEVRYLVSAAVRTQTPAFPTEPGAALRGGPAGARGRHATPDALIFEQFGTLDQWFDNTELFRRWSLAAQFAIGREVPLGGHALRADLRWSEGVTHQEWVPEVTRRTRAAQLAIGFLW